MDLRAIANGNRHGIELGMPFHVYREANGLNPSTISAGRKSPKHARHAYEREDKKTDAMDFGTALDDLIFDPDGFTDKVSIWDGGTRRGKEWEAFKSENDGKVILRAEGEYSYEHVIQCAEALLSEQAVKDIVAEGVAQVSGFTVEQTLQCKFRLDYLSNTTRSICDLKTTESIVPRAFYHNAYNRFSYGLKMACYRKWFQREANKSIDAVYLIVVEAKPPFDVAVVPVPDSELDRCWKEADAIIGSIRRAIETDEWHGVGGHDCILPLYLPPWELPGEEELTGYETVEAVA